MDRPVSKTRRAAPQSGVPATTTAKQWYDINFKVKLAFRKEFKQRAARHNMSMVQLLYACYSTWVRENDPHLPEMPSAGEDG